MKSKVEITLDTLETWGRELLDKVERVRKFIKYNNASISLYIEAGVTYFKDPTLFEPNPSKKSNEVLSYRRSIILYLLREDLKVTYRQLADLIGKKHSTCIMAVRKVKFWEEKYHWVKEDIKNIRTIVNNLTKREKKENINELITELIELSKKIEV